MTEPGQRTKAIVDIGEFIPDDVVKAMIEHRMCKVDKRIYNINDHLPKTPGRCARDGAEMFHGTDGQEEVIRERLAAFHQFAQPAIEYYRGRDLLEEVNGVGTPECIARGTTAVTEREENRGRQL